MLNLRKKRALSHSSSEDIRIIKKSPDHETVCRSGGGSGLGSQPNSAFSASSSAYRKRGGSSHASSTVSKPPPANKPSTSFSQYPYTCDSNNFDQPNETSSVFELSGNMQESRLSQPSTSHLHNSREVSSLLSVNKTSDTWRERSAGSNDGSEIASDSGVQLLRHEDVYVADDERSAATLADDTSLSDDDHSHNDAGLSPVPSSSLLPSSHIDRFSPNVSVLGSCEAALNAGEPPGTSACDAGSDASPTLESETRRVENICLEGSSASSVPSTACPQQPATKADSEALALSSEVTVAPQTSCEPCRCHRSSRRHDDGVQRNVALELEASDEPCNCPRSPRLPSDSVQQNVMLELIADSDDSDLEVLSVELARYVSVHVDGDQVPSYSKISYR